MVTDGPKVHCDYCGCATSAPIERGGRNYCDEDCAAKGEVIHSSQATKRCVNGGAMALASINYGNEPLWVPAETGNRI